MKSAFTMETPLNSSSNAPSETGFHKGVNIAQNDEYGRLRRQHLLHKHVMNDKLIRVPFPSSRPIKILDSATGDGLWTLDAGDEYPHATFVGTDVSYQHFCQIPCNLNPGNISFEVQNLLGEWPAEDKEAYDLVHQRYCLALFTPAQDQEIIERLWELVKPGGYIQFVESDMMIFQRGPEHAGMTRFMTFAEKAFPMAGMNHRPGPAVKGWLESAGAKDVREEEFEFKTRAAAASEEMRKVIAEHVNATIGNMARAASCEFD
jgi:hypothetical protein